MVSRWGTGLNSCWVQVGFRFGFVGSSCVQFFLFGFRVCPGWDSDWVQVCFLRLRLGSGLVLLVQVGFRFGFRLCSDWFQVWVRTLFRSGAGLALASQAWFRLGSNFALALCFWGSRWMSVVCYY